jgi:ABC-type Mn2+/Zn2+ transport system permease subunit
LLEILSPNGIVAPLVGVYLLARRMVFLGVALPQVSTAGIAAAFIWHAFFHGHPDRDINDFAIALVGSSLLTFGVIVMLAFLERRKRGILEGRVAMLYAVAGAATILLVASDRITEIGILGLLKGEIIAIPDTELLILLLGYGAILVLLTVFHKELVLVTVDREMAISLGKCVLVWDMLLFGIIGVTISLGVLVVGPLVMFGFLIVPPMIAGRLAIGMWNLSVVAAVLGAGVALIGFAVAYRLDWPTGPTDVALAGVVLALVTAGQAMRTFVFRAAAK